MLNFKPTDHGHCKTDNIIKFDKKEFKQRKLAVSPLNAQDKFCQRTAFRVPNFKKLLRCSEEKCLLTAKQRTLAIEFLDSHLSLL